MFENKKIKIFLSLFLTATSLLAQDIVAKKGSYGVDNEKKIIVWHESNLDSTNATQSAFKQITFDDTFQFTTKNSALTYSQVYTIRFEDKAYRLYITKLPIVHITLDTTTLNNNTKLPGQFTYFKDGNYKESAMGIRQRGNLSLSFPKKSYDIELRKNSTSKESVDFKFKGLRKDDDWILDGLYNEPLKIRSYVATKLWLELSKPYYLSKEPKAKSGFNVKYVELFRNNEYRGLYALSESVDRKLLKLKKNKGNAVFGELFKANAYNGGTAFKAVETFNNLSPFFIGFRMEYPTINTNAYWNNLAKFLDLVVKQPDDVFIEDIEQYSNISNAVDYFIFINTIRAGDNLGKNYYLAKYNKDEPYFFIPWDLDTSYGNAQIGRRLTNTTDILSNGFFDRLLALNPQNYKAKLKSRWKQLRAKTLSNEKISERFETLYNRFTEEKIYERNQLLWPKRYSDGDDYGYLKDWIETRMTVLDTYFESL